MGTVTQRKALFRETGCDDRRSIGN